MLGQDWMQTLGRQETLKPPSGGFFIIGPYTLKT